MTVVETAMVFDLSVLSATSVQSCYCLIELALSFSTQPRHPQPFRRVNSHVFVDADEYVHVHYYPYQFGSNHPHPCPLIQTAIVNSPLYYSMKVYLTEVSHRPWILQPLNLAASLIVY